MEAINSKYFNSEWSKRDGEKHINEQGALRPRVILCCDSGISVPDAKGSYIHSSLLTAMCCIDGGRLPPSWVLAYCGSFIDRCSKCCSTK